MLIKFVQLRKPNIAAWNEPIIQSPAALLKVADCRELKLGTMLLGDEPRCNFKTASDINRAMLQNGKLV